MQAVLPLAPQYYARCGEVVRIQSQSKQTRKVGKPLTPSSYYRFNNEQLTRSRASDDIREQTFGAAKNHQAGYQQTGAYSERDARQSPGKAASKQRVSKSQNHACHGIQADEYLPA